MLKISIQKLNYSKSQNIPKFLFSYLLIANTYLAAKMMLSFIFNNYGTHYILTLKQNY